MGRRANGAQLSWSRGKAEAQGGQMGLLNPLPAAEPRGDDSFKSTFLGVFPSLHLFLPPVALTCFPLYIILHNTEPSREPSVAT